MRKIYSLLFLFFISTFSFAQTYLSESFETEFTPNTAAGPNAPTGWTQTRLGALTSVPGTPGTSGQRDWARSVWSGTAWASNTLPNVNQIPYNSGTNGPAGAQQGTSALWFNDGYAAGSGTSGQNLRRIETPSIDLSTSITPCVTFYHSQNASSASLTVLGSLDGGTTWNTLSTYSSTSTWSWAQRIVAIPTAYKIATAKFALQVSNTWGSYDVFVDNFVVREGVAPIVPTTFTTTAITSAGMTIGWTDNSTNETAFRVYRSTDNITFTQVGTDVASTTSAGAGTAYSQVQTGLLANKTYYFRVVAVYEVESTYLTGSQLTSPAASFVSTSAGGLWNDAATWAGGAVPGTSDNVTIADGAVVTLNAAITAGSITIGQGTSGVLQWNGTTNALTVQNDLIISNGAKLYAYTTGGTGQAINVGGNFTNNGYANLAQSSTVLSLNGSQQGTSLSQVLGGTGNFQGNGTSGIIRTLFLLTTGSTSINTTQNLITSNFGHGAGSVNTNGKLTIDNTAQVYGLALNTQVANIAVTTMGTAYANAPVVFGASVTLWTAGGSATINTRYFSGNNVYIATAAGTFDGSTAPSHTSGSVTNGAVPLLWLGTLGTIGTPFVQTSVSVGTQYFYGNNLYVCTVAGVPSITAPPVHTSGAVVSGAATFLYIGSPASVSPNYDATTKTVRNLTVVGAGSGYTSAPSISFSLNGGTVTTAASATAVLIQSIAGPSNSLGQKSGIATVTGTININSNQNASSYSGVGAITTTNGGVNYTVAPTIGFAGPTAINLVTNGGSGYTTAPTITVTGGTLVFGTALTSSNFTITVAGGKIVSVYLNASTGATYSVPPTLAFSAGTATLAFPAGCWPSATAVIGTNGQITNFTVTNAGFGYVTAPTLGIGATSATAEGGTFTTIATTPTCRIALYNISYGYFAPAATNVINSDLSLIPSNGKANNITIATAAGASISTSMELFSSAPLTLTTGLLDFGSNTVTCSNVGYAGASGSATSSVAGKITLSTPGGSLTRTFPYDLPVAVVTGSGSLATGSTVTSLISTRTAAPTGTVNASAGTVTGTRAYRLQANAGSTYGVNPTVTLNYNATDALTAADNPSLLIGQASALSGTWTVRSLSSGTGSLSATGTRTTATSVAGPIVPTGDDYFAWIAGALCSGTPTTGVISGSTDACVGGTISFTSSVYSTGGGMTYRWQTSPDNVTWTNTTTTTAGSYSATYATSLWVRRVDTCSNSGLFAISNTIQVTTRPATMCYCGPNTGAPASLHGSFASNSIDNVTITGTTLNNSNVGIGTIATGYTEFPSTGATTATLLQGTSYNVVTTLSTASIASVWIDYNRNGTYEASEWAQITTTGSGVITTAINVPPTASLGLTGMRVRTRGTGSANAGADACTTFSSGETEEYYITIAAPPGCSGTPTAGTITGPAAGTTCVGTTATLTATGYTNGVSGVTYRWQSSPDNSVWTNTNGTTPASYSTPLFANTWFRLVDTCTNGNAFAVSNSYMVNVSSSFPIPYTENFDGVTVPALPSCTSVLDVNADSKTWTSNNTSTYLIGGTNSMTYLYNASLAADDWFFTVPLSLTGNTQYTLKFSALSSTSFAEKLEVKYGPTADVAGMTSAALYSNTALAGSAKVQVPFTPATSGTYFIGFHAFSAANKFYLSIDSLVVDLTSNLPVTLSNFKGERQGANNLLSWTTVTESNNTGFELQRSADGVNFSSLTFVASKALNGNSNTALTYAFTDSKSLIAGSYYRLKQIDKDGKSTLSQIVFIKGTKPSKLELVSVYPNPAVNTLNVSMVSPKADNIIFIVSDIAGKVVVKQAASVSNGDNNIKVNVSNLAKGTYTIKAICADGCETAISKFVKQ